MAAGFGSGTKSKLDPLCGLARGNLQPPEVVDLFSESETSLFNFMLDLKAPSKHYDKSQPDRILCLFSKCA